MVLLVVGSAFAADPAALVEARRAIGRHLTDPGAADALVAHLGDAADRVERELAAVGPSAGASRVVIDQVVASLDEKSGRGLVLDPVALRSTVIDYEAFKLQTYVTSGVFPKRYFGFVDGRSDSAADEIAVLETARDAVRAIDAWQVEQKRPVRITDLEVVTTFLAEGGALWLGKKRAIHPVMDVGLDDVASGAHDSADLIARVDRAAHTDLAHLVAWSPGGGALPVASAVPNEERWLQHANGEAGPFPYLTRYMTVPEAVAGTAVMYLWEKERADGLLTAAHAAPITGRSLDEQYVIGSLVYNSGLLHDQTRWRAILGFSTGDWVRQRSLANQKTRPPLNLLAPREQLAEIVTQRTYRDQQTSWLAVYHVLQRYGAFVALHRFTDRFDAAGAITSIPTLAAPLPPTVPPPPVPSGGCDTAPGGGWLAIVGATAALRPTRRRSAPGGPTARPPGTAPPRTPPRAG